MKAIILAAGYGRRMRPLTDETHKTLLKIADKTIISRIIDGLCENGITDIVVVTGYQRAQLVDYLNATYPQVCFTFVDNARYRETNNIFSMSLAFDSIEIDDDVLLIESDLIYEPAVIRRILDSEHANVALVDKFASGMDGTVVSLDGDAILNITPPHLQGSDFDFSDKYKTLNIYRFSQEFCKTVFRQLLTHYAKFIDDSCYYELILGVLIYMQAEVIHAEVLDGEKWAEVDDPNDLRVAEFEFNPARKREILEEAFGGYWNHNILDFCFIRNMYFPNGSILSEMRNNLPNLLQNYGSKQEILNQKLAYLLLCNEQNVNVLNGASQIYPMLRQRFSGRSGLIPEPTFGEYPALFGDYDVYCDEVGMDPAEIATMSKESDVTVIVNPNNPTGSTLPTEWIYRFAHDRPGKTVVVDESFIEFSPFESIVRYLEEDPLENVIVVKSLSKSLGVPGIRLGYVYSCSGAFNESIRRDLPIWNLNSVAEYMLEIMLKHRDSLAESYVETVRDREAMARDLAELSIVDKVHPSGANFLLVRLKEGVDGSLLVDKLLYESSIFVKEVTRKFAHPGSYLRLAVRLPEENERLVECLRKSASTIV